MGAAGALAAGAEAEAAPRVQVWDLPVRVVHWSLVLAVAAAVATGFAGGNWMRWHGRAGLAIVGLLAFRLAWGFVGSTHARFASFAPTPRRLRAYLAGRWQGPGHNPLGALSVFAVLALLALQLATGLFGNDDIAYAGPLAALVGEDRARWLTGWHQRLAWGLLGLLALHVAAIVFHLRVKRDDLLTPMLTGWRHGAPAAAPRRAGAPAFVLALALALGAVYVAAGGLLEPAAPAFAPAPAW